MAITANDVVTLAREFLNDMEPDSYRFETSTLVRYVESAQREAVRLRPDLLLQADQSVASITDPTSVGSNLTVPEEFREALAAQVASMALRGDDPDTVNEMRARLFRRDFLLGLGQYELLAREGG